jgi:hypothetical protein
MHASARSAGVLRVVYRAERLGFGLAWRIRTGESFSAVRASYQHIHVAQPANSPAGRAML